MSSRLAGDISWIAAKHIGERAQPRNRAHGFGLFKTSGSSCQVRDLGAIVAVDARQLFVRSGIVQFLSGCGQSGIYGDAK